jgi:hypothetical protein
MGLIVAVRGSQDRVSCVKVLYFVYFLLYKTRLELQESFGLIGIQLPEKYKENFDVSSIPINPNISYYCHYYLHCTVYANILHFLKPFQEAIDCLSKQLTGSSEV